jgi:transposase-like protein
MAEPVARGKKFNFWRNSSAQRCTVHKHRNLLARAPQRLDDEVSADYNDMIYAASPVEIEQRRFALIRKMAAQMGRLAGPALWGDVPTRQPRRGR